MWNSSHQTRIRRTTTQAMAHHSFRRIRNELDVIHPAWLTTARSCNADMQNVPSIHDADGSGKSDWRCSVRYKGIANTETLASCGLLTQIQVPERWAPYVFDIFGSSHQLMHVAVVVAAWIHSNGLVDAFHHVRAADHSCVGLVVTCGRM
jgi:hypothetical protein